MPPRRVRRRRRFPETANRAGRGLSPVAGRRKERISPSASAGIAPAPPNNGAGAEGFRRSRRREQPQDILKVRLDLRDVLEIVLTSSRPALHGLDPIWL